MQVLQKCAEPRRPPVSVSAPVGPSRISYDRNATTVRKRDAARAADGGDAQPGTWTGTEESAESEGQALWDEDDVMLFFWGNSQAAKQRHLKKVQENTQRMEHWREGVPRVLSFSGR
jgi:hypothetical protein